MTLNSAGKNDALLPALPGCCTYFLNSRKPIAERLVTNVLAGKRIAVLDVVMALHMAKQSEIKKIWGFVFDCKT